jgi:hypothetical protein
MKLFWAVLILGITGGAIYGINRGLFIGSTTTTKTSSYSLGGEEKHSYTTISKNCLYLFITGIVELPALGGSPRTPGQRFEEEPDTLHCQIFAE